MQKKSAKEILKRIEGLLPEQKEFIYSKNYEDALSADKWMRFFKKIIVLDNSVDEILEMAKKRKKWFMIATIVIFFISFGLFFPAVLLPISGGIWLFYIIRVKRFKKIDIDNKCKSFVIPFIAIIKEDCGPKQKIALNVNFSPVENPGFLISDEKLPNKGYPKVRILVFQKQWFSGSYQMLDNSTVNFSFERVLRVKKVTKKNPRGKIKFKKKSQERLLVNCIIKIDKTKYAIKPGAKNQHILYFPRYGNSKGLIRFNETDKQYVFKIKAGFIDRRNPEIEFPLTAEDASGLIANAFSMLQPK